MHLEGTTHTKFDAGSFITLEVIPSKRFWTKLWLPWQRLVLQTQKHLLSHQNLNTEMSTKFDLNSFKNVEVNHSIALFKKRCGYHGNAIPI